MEYFIDGMHQDMADHAPTMVVALNKVAGSSGAVELDAVVSIGTDHVALA